MYVGAAMIPLPRASKAMELLKTLPRADLIITQNEIGHEKTSLEIYKYIQKFEREIPILTLGHNHLLAKKTFMKKRAR
jgi:hypothetical protein